LEELKTLLTQYIAEAHQHAISHPGGSARQSFLNWRIDDIRHTIQTLIPQAENELTQRLEQYSIDAIEHAKTKPQDSHSPENATWMARAEYLEWIQSHIRHTLEQLRSSKN
jgi:hypothetical protein